MVKASEDAHVDLDMLNAALEVITEAASKLLSDMEGDLRAAAQREDLIKEMREETAATTKLIMVNLYVRFTSSALSVK